MKLWLSLVLVLSALVGRAQQVRYEIWCQLEPGKREMKLQTVATGPWMDKVEFSLAETMSVPKVELLGSGEPVTLNVTETSKSNGNRIMTVTPPLSAKSSKLQLRFTYQNADTKGFVYYLGPEACFAGGYNTIWYPRFGDERALGRLHFDVPTGYVVKASGKLSKEEKKGDRQTYDFEAEQPVLFTFSAARYHITRIDGPLPVTIYSLKERANAKEYAEGCFKVLKVLQREFGPYPFPDFSIVETPSPQSSTLAGFSGASFEGFMFADSSSLDIPFNLAYFGHEMGHQWWGNLVQRTGPKGSYLMSEGLAQFGSLQCVREIEGAALAFRYRYMGYPSYSANQSLRGSLMYGPAGIDKPVATLPEEYDVAYHQLANSKGFLVWDTLARQVGRDRFRKALQVVTKKYAWKAVTFDQLVEEIQRATGRDIQPLIQQWFYRTGAPCLSSTWKQDGSRLTIEIQQTAPLYTLSIPVSILLSDGSTVVKEVAVSQALETVELAAKQRVVDVKIDPMFEVYHTTPALQEEANALKSYAEGFMASLRGKSTDALKAFEAGLTALPKPDPYGVEFRLRAALGREYFIAGKLPEAKTQFQAAVECPTRDAEYLPWVYFRLATIAQREGDAKRLEWAFRNIESADRALPYPSGAWSAAQALKPKQP